MIKSSLYKFEPGALSIVQMGEELVGHPTTAINELVKNSYDADATISKIYLEYNQDNNKSFLIISDNGLGMNGNTLFGNWLRPSVSAKRQGVQKSRIFSRNYLGSKGIGRLASMALGRYITVISKTIEDGEYNWLFIDRNSFREETLLSGVNFPGGTTTSLRALLEDESINECKKQGFNPRLQSYLETGGISEFAEGTVIIVETLDESIKTIIEDETTDGNRDIEDLSLIRSLKVLITPLALSQTIQDELIKRKILDHKQEISSPESSFKVLYGSNLFRNLGIAEDFISIEQFSILDNFDYRVMGKVNRDGSVDGFYFCNRLVEDSFESKFLLTQKEVFSEESTRKRNVPQLSPLIVDSGRVGQFFFDIRVYDRDPEAMHKLQNLLNTRNRRETAEVIDRFIGLRISKNGFGIKPYGEGDKDWMGLGEMRVQDPSMILGTNQIIGNVFLFSPENDALNEKTNREGFFENDAFLLFKKTLRAILIDTGKRRNNYRQKHGLGRKASSRHERPDVSQFANFLEKVVGDKGAVKEAKGFLNEITTAFDNLENSLTFSQRLAALGSGLELVYHEMAQPISLIGKCLFSMKFELEKISNHAVREELIREMNQIKMAITTLDKLKDSLEPAIGRSRKVDFKPLDIFNKVCLLFAKDIKASNISVVIDPKLETFTVKDSEYTLWISFLNVLNNAVYWLKSEDTEQRKIIFDLGENYEMRISNSGPKIEESELENIFNYGVTHKKVKNATGLGLAFTRSILSASSWDIWAENVSYGPMFIIKRAE